MEPEEQHKLQQQMHRVIYDDQPYTFLFMDKFLSGRDARLENVKYYKIRPCYDTREWYSKQPRRNS